MRTYEVVIEGRTPLLIHNDNIEWADMMDEWKVNPENKKVSKAGDDRSPAWRWIGCCYHDGKVLTIPQANIMVCMREGGTMVPVPGGKSGKTFKAQTQSGMMCVEEHWPLETAAGMQIKWDDIQSLMAEENFKVARAYVQELGFDLLVKRAKIGTSKHVRVRPRFEPGWKIRGHISVWDDQITDTTLASILEYAGQYKGLCDWRPGSPKPGPYGTFTANLKRV